MSTVRRVGTALFLLSLAFSPARGAAAPADAESLSVTLSSTPVPQNGSSAKYLVIHKPMPSPSWGKVLQYRKEEIPSSTDKGHETLYEFLFQDDHGVIRTATYHETASGDGYWEVIVWDQP